ncbi:hypothetical protein AB0O67_29855 [Streptomyces sp. NPDC086077]|uniref:hypothetical protein n=1 Tax=Streptomyces sp. NPDC086077 TaxID=3154862 RepID=UPI0034496D53
MSALSRPHLKSIPTAPDGPQAAPHAVDPAAVGEPKGAARKGVRTSPDSQKGTHGDPTPDRPGIRVYAPPVYRHHHDGARWSKRYGDTPTAAYACPCGQTDTATGPNSVAALVTEYEAHKHFCTGAPGALTEGRTAA